MKTLKIKAVIITDGKEYFIHGVSEESPPEMFKAMLPLWDVDPTTDTIHHVEFEMNLPEMENLAELADRDLDWKVEADRASSDD